MNEKPNEKAQSLYLNAYYFTGNKIMAKELTLFIIENILRLKLKIDDQIYWKLTKEHAYDLGKEK